MADDSYAVVYPGGDFPKGAVRAMNRGLECGDPNFCDSFVALWIRDDGEAVFGRAYCDPTGKCKASFPFAGAEVLEDQTQGFRVLTYVGRAHGFQYQWVRATDVKPEQLMYSGEYSPVVVQCPDGEVLGKAHWGQRRAWATCAGQEVLYEGPDFDNCHLLCKVPIVAP